MSERLYNKHKFTNLSLKEKYVILRDLVNSWE
jgi:hypothetical protein